MLSPMLEDTTTHIAVFTPLLVASKSGHPLVWYAILLYIFYILSNIGYILSGTLFSLIMWRDIIDIMAPESGTAFIIIWLVKSRVGELAWEELRD